MKISIHSPVVHRTCVFAVLIGLLAISSAAEAGIGGTDLRVGMQGIGGSDLDVLGVVETADRVSSAIVVSGQTVHLTSGTKLSSTGSAQVALPAKGSLVAVYGSVNSDGTITASQISLVGSSYVAGATTLYVRGIVKSVNPTLARAQVGSLWIDYSASLYAPSGAPIAAGSIAEFSGLQTSSTLFASKSDVIKNSNSAAGIGGTDKATLGIGGTDKATLGIGGTDKATLGIGGTDKATLGIGGTDKATLGIGGTDKATLGIGGTDRVATAAGIGGTD